MPKKYQIFISSTYSDLIEERQAAVEAVLRASHIPAGMELFSAGSESQLEIIKRWIEESDIYMLILGGRYGSVEPKSGLSYTEIEYNYALGLNKPLFAVIASDAYLDKKVKEKGKDVLELKHQKEYEAFKERVLTKISRFYNDHNDIKLATLESLLDIQSRSSLAGWIKSSEVPNVAELINQIEDLNEKNRNNEEKLRVLESGQINKIGEYTYEEIWAALKQITVTVPDNINFISKVDQTPIMSRITHVLDIFLNNADKLSIGINNGPEADEINLFLIKNVIAHLRIYDLAEIVKIPNSSWLRFQTSKLGNKFLAISSIRKAKNKKLSAPHREHL